MKNLLKISVTVAFCIGAFSCNLEEDLKGDFSEDEEVANPGVSNSTNVTNSTPSDGLAGAFGRVLGGTANHGSYFSLQELSSDEAVITQKGGDWYDGGVLIDIHKHNFSSVGFGIGGAWGDAYGGIFQCNDLMDNVGMPDASIQQLRVLRAYFYWRLLDVFGRVKLTVSPGVDVPQSTRAQVYAFVRAELLTAINSGSLPTGKPAYGRVAEGTAYALLSRLYLNSYVYKGIAINSAEYLTDLQSAVDAADEVINSGVYNLASSYANLFAPDNAQDKGADAVKVSDEVLFLAPFDEKTGQGMNFGQMTLHYPSQLTFKLTSQPWNGYSSVEEFYNSYDAADVRKANNFIVGPQVDFAGNPILDLAFDPADDDGAPINYTPAINELFPSGSRQAGARLGKFKMKIGQTPNMDNDYPLIRYAEVVMNKAEALCRISGAGSIAANPIATTLVDLVRARAGLGSIGTITAVNLLAERGREFFQEGLRRPDLIRFGKFHTGWWESPAHADDHRKLFPIPNDQILAAGGTLTQNPGY